MELIDRTTNQLPLVLLAKGGQLDCLVAGFNEYGEHEGHSDASFVAGELERSCRRA